MFASDGLVSASTYNILCQSISAIPFSLSMRLARPSGLHETALPGKGRMEKSPPATDAAANLERLCHIIVNSLVGD